MKRFLAVVMPILRARGGSVANTLMSASVVRDTESMLAQTVSNKQVEATLLFQFIL